MPANPRIQIQYLLSHIVSRLAGEGGNMQRADIPGPGPVSQDIGWKGSIAPAS